MQACSGGRAGQKCLQKILESADTRGMSALGPVIKAVLTNKTVIVTAIIVFLYLDFVCFVARYRKKNKPAAPKKRAVAAPAPEPAAESGGGDGGAGGDGGGEDAE